MSAPLTPGATLGVLGSGQLGRMFALAARPMGYRVITLSPGEATPTGQVADDEITADYDDEAALASFAERVDVVTVEFENIPRATLDWLAERRPVRPGPEVVGLCQHRMREKTGLARLGYPTVEFWPVHGLGEFEEAMSKLRGPGVLKTAGFGYDGKGQRRVKPGDDLSAVWADLGADAAVLERWMSFTAELSVVGVRSVDGDFACYGPILNDHAHHVLDVSVLGASLEPAVTRRAIEITRGVMSDLDAVGVLCVEFFLGADGALVINEMAPRPHNSGHLTIEGCVSSQFHQQVRTICGLPPAPITPAAPVAAMVNLLGDLWSDGAPRWDALTRWPDVNLHLYGKGEARPGRKMGHMTAVGDDVEGVRQRLLDARAALRPGAAPA